MFFLKKIIAQINCGRGFSKFINSDYVAAAKFFEKACKYKEAIEDVSFVYASLGRCYLEIGREKEAYSYIESSYKQFQNMRLEKMDKFQKNQYVNMLKAYSYLLKKYGDSELAKTIDDKIEREGT